MNIAKRRPTSEVSKRELEQVARAGGAVLFGVARVPIGVPPAFAGFDRAVVAAVALSRGVVASCISEPTRAYAYHYRVVNATLDHIACRLVSYLEEHGFETLAVPASQVLDWGDITGAVSHPRLAMLAGLGFIGRHNILVTPTFGAAVRLVSVFTKAPLAPDAPAGGDCGACHECRGACPAAAIGETAAAWARDRCLDQLRDFKKRITGQYICGVCVRVCGGPSA